MKNIKKVIGIIILLVLIQSCKKDPKTIDPPVNNNLKYFGFTLVDVGWDDPTDASVKTNYVDEVAAFSNVADILVVNPTDVIQSRVQLMSQNNMKAIIHVSELFFYYTGSGGSSGSLYDLRSDYQSRWDTFILTNNISINNSLIQSLYLGEEPTWNSISFLELKLAADYIKSTVPTIPIMIIEAYPVINSLQVPTTVDWVGFDHYFIEDPNNSTEFLNELAVLKSKRSTTTQKIILVLDAHYIASQHGAMGITESEMASVATSYYKLALKESDVIGLLGYFWPGGFDDPSSKGARGLPQASKDEYNRIGKLITGK